MPCRAVKQGRGHLTSIDTSQYWISRAGKRLQRYNNVDCLYGDIRQLNLPDSAFDVIPIIHVLHDIPPEERATITGELERTLKPGGKLFIREHIEESHGMPITEIQPLLSVAQLKETSSNITKTEYTGCYQKIS